MNSTISMVRKQALLTATDLEYTSLVSIHLIMAGISRRVRLKLEGENPTGSSKYRTAKALMIDLEARKLLKPDSIVIESTSGNLGVALASICRMLGLSFLAIIDPKTTDENISKMMAFGAKTELVNEPDVSGGFLLTRLKRLRELQTMSDRYVWTDQYSNWANPLAHYMQTGPEILTQAGGSLQAVYIPVSTGGTLAGVGRYLREASPATLVVAVDAAGSVVFGGKAGPRKLTGIGSSRRSDFLSRSHYDEFRIVSDRDAFQFCRALRLQTGIDLGGSSGATLVSCFRHLQEHPELTDVCCICPDNGENYRSTLYNDDWLVSNGFTVDTEEISKMIPTQEPERQWDRSMRCQAAAPGSV